MATRLKKVGGGATVLGLLAIFIIGGYEGLRLYSYRDVVGVWTYCYGETWNARPGMKFTKEECDKIFLDMGLTRHEQGMRRCLSQPDIVPTKTYVAMLSLTYNIGIGGFCKSSIARKWNAGDRYGACNAFSLYNKAGGRVIKGLVTRRASERALCVDGLDELVTVNFEHSVLPQDRPVLRRGSSGFWVEQLQRDLRMNDVDGQFGPATETAVKAWQANHGLNPDGIVGRLTWTELAKEE